MVVLGTPHCFDPYQEDFGSTAHLCPTADTSALHLLLLCLKTMYKRAGSFCWLLTTGSPDRNMDRQEQCGPVLILGTRACFVPKISELH